jgi:hypothetical protein
VTLVDAEVGLSRGEDATWANGGGDIGLRKGIRGTSPSLLWQQVNGQQRYQMSYE